MNTDIQFEKLRKIAADIEAAIFSPTFEESEITIRVIGEFSAGKTRFIRHLFGEKIAPPLRPISSMEVQTRIPLEITWGPNPRLELIRRAQDYEASEVLEVFEQFPERTELEKRPLENCRLRLFVDEPRLLLKADETGISQPQILRFIDQPGWNSVDEAEGWEALGLSGEWNNLALVYVSRITRLDSAANMRNLAMFIDALQDSEMLRAKTPLPLFFVITECPENERALREKALLERVERLFDRHPERFALSVIALDFAQCDERALEKMRQKFWRHILASPSEDACLSPAQEAVAAWPPEWDLAPWLKATRQWAKEVQELARGLKRDGRFLLGREMSFFAGYKAHEIGDAAWRQWRKMLGRAYADDALASLAPPPLQHNHPLKPWFDYYWKPRLMDAPLSIRNYMEKMKWLLEHKLHPDIRDLEAWAAPKLADDYEAICEPFSIAFQSLLNVAETFPANMGNLQILCTLLSLSLMETSLIAKVMGAQNQGAPNYNMAPQSNSGEKSGPGKKPSTPKNFFSLPDEKDCPWPCATANWRCNQYSLCNSPRKKRYEGNSANFF